MRIIANDIPKTARERYKQITTRGKKMKTNRFAEFVSFQSHAALAAVVAQSAASPPRPAAFASAEEHVDDGLAVSKTWDESDRQRQLRRQLQHAASNAMHDKVQQDHWSAYPENDARAFGARC